MVEYIPIAIVLVLGGLVTWGGFRALKRKRLLENVPTSKAKGVFLGLNEVKGTSRTEDPLTSYLAGEPCVHYTYAVKERWERTETERDSKGNTRTVTKSGWRTVDSGGESIPFDLEDDTGRLLVDPHRAEVHGVTVFSHTCGRGDPLYYDKGPSHATSDSDHRRRFTEDAIPADERVYVIGPARMREDDVVAPMIAHDENAEIFMVSMRSERQLTRGYAWKAFGMLLVGAVAAFAVPVVLALPDSRDLETALRQRQNQAIGAAGIYLAAVALFYLVQIYNGLVAVRERLEMAWSMLEVQLKRRHDLIPRLVACVKGAAAHESDVQERLAAVRVEGVTGRSAGTSAAANQGSALRSVMMLAESYPELRTDANFARLQTELIDTEDRIALAREFHNSSVEAMNGRIQTLPDVLVARLTGFREQPYFAHDGFDRSPRIDLET